MQIDVSESGEGSCDAVQLIFKSRPFLLQLGDYGLHECLGHSCHAITGFFVERSASLAVVRRFEAPLHFINPSLEWRPLFTTVS